MAYIENIEQCQIKDIIEPGNYRVVCQVIDNNVVQRNRPYMIVSDGTNNPHITKDQSYSIPILLENLNDKFQDLCRGIVVKFHYIKVRRFGIYLGLLIDCSKCKILRAGFLERECLKQKVTQQLRGTRMPSHFHRPLQEIIQEPISVSLELSEEEQEMSRGLANQIGCEKLKTKIQRCIKLLNINARTQMCCVYGYIVKITRLNDCPQQGWIGSTIHIVDESLPFGSSFLVHLFSKSEDNPVTPEIQKVIRINDMKISENARKTVPHGVATSAKNVTFFTVKDSNTVIYEMSAKTVADSDCDEQCVKIIWNDMKEHEIRCLNDIYTSGYYKFQCEISALYLHEKHSSLCVNCGCLASCTTEIQLLNITLSFKNLKRGDHVKFSRVRVTEKTQGGLSFMLDCKACEVEKMCC